MCKICFTAGGSGGGFCTDPLSRRVYERRAGYENQPNRGSRPGETLLLDCPDPEMRYITQKSAPSTFGQRK